MGGEVERGCYLRGRPVAATLGSLCGIRGNGDTDTRTLSSCNRAKARHPPHKRKETSAVWRGFRSKPETPYRALASS
ncbi:hypothetical protein TMatcc_004615 [Talaromyces marneffei ATCC 18224]